MTVCVLTRRIPLLDDRLAVRVRPRLRASKDRPKGEGEDTERSGVPQPALDAELVGHDRIGSAPGWSLAASSSDSECWSLDLACDLSLLADGLVEASVGVFDEAAAVDESECESWAAGGAESLFEVEGGLVLVELSGGDVP